MTITAHWCFLSAFELVPSRSVTLPTRDREAALPRTLVARGAEFACTLAFTALLGDRGFEVAGPITTTAFLPILFACSVAVEALLRWAFMMPGPGACATDPYVISRAFAGSALECPGPITFTSKACPIVVDRTNEVFPNRAWSVLVALRSGAVVLPEKKVEETHRGSSHSGPVAYLHLAFTGTVTTSKSEISPTTVSFDLLVRIKGRNNRRYGYAKLTRF